MSTQIWINKNVGGKIENIFLPMLNFPVYSYGHAGMVSSPNHTFFLGKLE